MLVLSRRGRGSRGPSKDAPVPRPGQQRDKEPTRGPGGTAKVGGARTAARQRRPRCVNIG